MFTGSFHPLYDNLWEDRINWDKRVMPQEPIFLLDIFKQRANINFQILEIKVIIIIFFLFFFKNFF